AAVLDALHPVVEHQLFAQVDVTAADPDALAVDAREVGLAADAAGVAAVQRVVPDVQLPDRRRVHRGDEVAHAVADVHDVLGGADAVHGRHDVVGQLARAADVQPPAAVGEADDGALALGPLEDRQVPAGPVVDQLRPGVVLLAQAQQADVAAVAGGEA